MTRLLTARLETTAQEVPTHNMATLPTLREGAFLLSGIFLCSLFLSNASLFSSSSSVRILVLLGVMNQQIKLTIPSPFPDTVNACLRSVHRVVLARICDHATAATISDLFNWDKVFSTEGGSTLLVTSKVNGVSH